MVYRPWSTKAPIMVSISLIGFKLLSGQRFNGPGHCDLDLLNTDQTRNVFQKDKRRRIKKKKKK